MFGSEQHEIPHAIDLSDPSAPLTNGQSDSVLNRRDIYFISHLRTYVPKSCTQENELKRNEPKCKDNKVSVKVRGGVSIHLSNSSAFPRSNGRTVQFRF